MTDLEATPPAIADIAVDAARAFPERPRPDRLERGAIGRRERSLVALRRGKYSRSRLAGSADVDVAVDATLRAAAARAGRTGYGLPSVASEDLRRKVREHRVPFEICFVVDNSYSLHADRLVEKVKGLVFALLEDAAARGDRVSLVAFRSGVAEATVALRPTGSLRVASGALRGIPLSGRTPLPHALRLAGRLLRQELRKRRNARPLLVVVSDGLPNVPLRHGGDPFLDVLAEARALRRVGIGLVIVDATPPERSGAGGCAEALALAGEGTLVRLVDLSPSAFAGLVESV